MFGLEWRLLGLKMESVFSKPTISESVEETKAVVGGEGSG